MASASTTEPVTAYEGAYVMKDDKWTYAINGQAVKNAVKMIRSDGTPTILAAELMPDKLLNLRGVAEALGLSYETARSYKAKNIIPAPVVVLGNVPLWTKPIIAAWDRQRIGQGGGRRPHRTSNSPFNVWRRTGEVT